MFSKLFGWLKKLLSKIIKLIKKFWPIIAIALVVFWPAIGPMLGSLWTSASGFLGTAFSWIKTAFSGVAAFAGEHGWLTTAALGLGALAVVSPETAKDVVENVVDVAKDVAEGVGEVATTTLKQPMLWIAGGLLAWFVLTRDKEESYGS